VDGPSVLVFQSRAWPGTAPPPAPALERWSGWRRPRGAVPRGQPSL